ncbi:MAG: sigma-70 family RNA polymerase sigma factor [Planctomycetia bacterium]|nr:sigma-70 family RNA polymerase sigma factor [Planctomycetia bacterium]
MSTDSSASTQNLLLQARAGNSEALGFLLENYRNYLTFLAKMQLDSRLSGKIDPTDIVQETCLEAFQAFPKFRGEQEGQFTAWLRQILVTKIAGATRHYFGTQRRDVRLEQNLHTRVDQSSVFWDHLICSTSTPSMKIQRKEAEAQLLNALEQLPPHYREVLQLRHLENFTFPQIAEKMERTVDSVQKIWVRALAQLRGLITDA